MPEIECRERGIGYWQDESDFFPIVLDINPSNIEIYPKRENLVGCKERIATYTHDKGKYWVIMIANLHIPKRASYWALHVDKVAYTQRLF